VRSEDARDASENWAGRGSVGPLFGIVALGHGRFTNRL